MNTVTVRNVEIGAGMPKICVPIVGETREDILAEARAIRELPADRETRLKMEDYLKERGLEVEEVTN